MNFPYKKKEKKRKMSLKPINNREDLSFSLKRIATTIKSPIIVVSYTFN